MNTNRPFIVLGRLAQVAQFARLCVGVVAAALSLIAHQNAYAGQECGERPASGNTALAKGELLGRAVRDQLEGSGASMAFVARVGLDLSEFGQRYTHMGVALRDHLRGSWQVMHLYNLCGKAQSDILVQQLADFFKVELHATDTLMVVPTQAAQANLRQVFLNVDTARLLHTNAYNMIAHPYSVRFQNSNQWILEMIAMGFGGRIRITNRTEAQKWLRSGPYRPGSIAISALRRAGAVLVSPHISFADHSAQEREEQRYQVVTVDSIVDLLQSLDPDAGVSVLKQ